MLKYMLDTNIVIYVIKRKPVAVIDKFNTSALRICVSSITYADLIFGVEKSSKAAHKEFSRVNGLRTENRIE